MNNFKDFFIEFQENELKNKEELKYGPTELIFERYFDSLCSVQSNYDFYKFLGDLYEHAREQAKNCIELGFDIEKIQARSARNWIESLTECINALLVKFLLRKGIKFDENAGSSEKEIYNKLKDLDGSDYLKLSNKLKRLWSKSRCNVAHTAKGLQLQKSPTIYKDALNFKNEYVEVHIDSLKNIRKDFPNYNK